jgi:hypothetical protein
MVALGDELALVGLGALWKITDKGVVGYTHKDPCGYIAQRISRFDGCGRDASEGVNIHERHLQGRDGI